VNQLKDKVTDGDNNADNLAENESNSVGDIFGDKNAYFLPGSTGRR
jgi:hypothetical protein